MYFPRPGPENTDKTIELAVAYARKAVIKHIVVATCSGKTAIKLLPYKNEFNIVAVGHVFGFAKRGENEMPEKNRLLLEDNGIKVLFTSHVLSGAERGLSNACKGIYPVEIMANTLRMFGQGVKVGVEISVMALDAGLIPYNTDIIAIGGTEEGADTAIVVRPAHAQYILETKILEIICKPRN